MSIEPVDVETGDLIDKLLAAFADVHGGVRFDVQGKPQPKGSMDRGWHGKAYHPRSVKEWTAAVTEAGSLAMRSHGPPFACPVFVHIDFWMPRHTATRKPEIWDYTKPDIDKLIRGVFDGLDKDHGRVMAEDSRVAAVAAFQRFVPHVRGRGSSPVPLGVRITVVPLDSPYDLKLEPWLVDLDGPPTWGPVDP